MPEGAMNTGQARVIDPILTEVAQGYRHPETVGHVLFPRVPVDMRGGQIIEFNRESFRRYNLRRAPGAATKRVMFGYQGKPFALVQDALEGMVPFEHLEDASQVPGIDMGQEATNDAMRIAELAREIEQSDLATDQGNYPGAHVVTLSGADKWSDEGSNPAKQIDDYKETIRASVGSNPNTLVLSGQAFKAYRNNPNVIERFKYTSRDSITAEMIAAMLDLERVVVGRAVYLDEDDNMVDVWGNHAILAYSPPQPSSAREPSYGYTYTMRGHPFVEEPYRDRNHKAWLYPVTYERVPVLSGIDSGFLIREPA